MKRTFILIVLNLLLLHSAHAATSGVVSTNFHLDQPANAPAGFFPTLWCAAPNGSIVVGNVALYGVQLQSQRLLNTQSAFSSIGVKNVAVATDGSVFLSGQLARLAATNDGMSSARIFHLAKLRPDGTLDPDFAPVFVTGSGSEHSLSEIGVTRITPDAEGGCFAGGRFNFANGIPAADLIHVNRHGQITPLLQTRVPQVTNPWCIIHDSGTVIVINTEGMARVVAPDNVKSFEVGDDIRWSRINGATFHPDFGVLLVGTGSIGSGQNDTFAAVYNVNGSRHRNFSTAVRFDSGAGSGNAVSWDGQGRVIIGFVQTVRDPEGTDGDIQQSSPLTGLVLEGVPSVIYSVKRLLPDGRLDPEWTRAVWFDRPPARIVVLPDNSVLVGGEFTKISGASSGSNIVHLVGGTESPDEAVQQSARGWIDARSQKLIMGLVITGKSGRDVIVRAVGPSLRKFGVSVTPEVTRLTLYRGDQMLLRTSGQSNTVPVTWAASKAGAFPLDAASQSREAQALISLFPGTYTIVIDTTDNSLPPNGGEVLGEVYFP